MAKDNAVWKASQPFVTGSLSGMSRRAAAGRAELLAKKRHIDRLQNLAKLRRFWIRGGIRGGIRAG